MRVALVIRKLSGLRGGAERVVIELARALRERGHEVTILTYEPGTDRPGYDPGDVPVIDLFPLVLRRAVGASRSSAGTVESNISRRGNRGRRSRLKWELTHGWFARRLSRWLRAHPHDVVVGFLPPAISAVALAGERLGRDRPRIIASTHNVPAEDFGPDGRWDPNPVTRATNLRALALVDAVTVLLPEFVEQLPADVQASAVVLPNPVARLAPPSGLPREDLLLGVGRLTDVKRFDVLIRAFARLAGELPGWRVVIYGDGPERARLEQLVADLDVSARVELPGTTDDLAPVYDTASVLVHPARYEGFGLAVAEAIAHGVPVIASRHCPGVNGLVEEGATGRLVDDDTDPVGAFCDAIRSTVLHPTPADVHQAAIDRLTSRLAPDRVYDQWERLLAP